MADEAAVNAGVKAVAADGNEVLLEKSAVQEFAEALMLVLDKHPEHRKAKILERIIEPERVIVFRVPWMTDRDPGSSPEGASPSPAADDAAAPRDTPDRGAPDAASGSPWSRSPGRPRTRSRPPAGPSRRSIP